MMLTLYVDEILPTGPNDNTVAKVRETIMDKFAMMDVGDATQTLGVDISQDKERGTISLNQGPYLLSLLEFKCGMVVCNPLHTPGIDNKLTAEPESS